MDQLVFGSGDRVTGWGWLRDMGDGVWFDSPYVWRTGNEPLMSTQAVRLQGADPGLAEPGPDGSGLGASRITGVWFGDAIRVEEQSPGRLPGPDRKAWTRPPCPPPSGGWPAGMNGVQDDNLDFDLGDLQDTGAAVAVVVFRPGPGRAVLVVAASDEAAVERRLRRQLGPRLCVVASRWTRDQLDAASSVLQERMRDWRITSFGRGVDEDGQAWVEVTVSRVLPEMARWAAGVPEGLLHVVSWLHAGAALRPSAVIEAAGAGSQPGGGVSGAGRLAPA